MTKNEDLPLVGGGQGRTPEDVYPVGLVPESLQALFFSAIAYAFLYGVAMALKTIRALF